MSSNASNRGRISVTLFCMNRHGSRDALKLLVEKGVNVTACVFEDLPPNELSDLCIRNNIPSFNYAQAQDAAHNGTLERSDYAISYMYQKIVKKDLIEFFDGNIINFHPAPVYVHRGRAACVYCLLKGYKEWATTAHFLTEGVDEGDIIAQRKFPVPNNGLITALEFEKVAQDNSLLLLGDLADMMIKGDPLPRTKQDPTIGQYYGMKDLLRDKDVHPDMKADEINRRIAALWFPPYHGASIVIDGERYSLVNKDILDELAELYAKNQDRR